MNEFMGRVHEAIRLKLNNFIHDKFRDLMTFHLYEAMPEHESHRELLPSIEIYIPGHDSLKLTMKVR